MQCTSPLTSAADFRDGVAAFSRTGADSLVTVVRTHRFLWKLGADGAAAPQNYDPVKRPRLQDWAGELIENGAFYVFRPRAETDRPAEVSTGLRLPHAARLTAAQVFKTAALRASGSRLSGKIVAHEMPEETLAEIDSRAAASRISGLWGGRGAIAAASPRGGRVDARRRRLVDWQIIEGLAAAKFGDEPKKWGF